jgi:hypothetical protein
MQFWWHYNRFYKDKIMDNIKQLKIDYEKINNFYFDNKTIEAFIYACNNCIKLKYNKKDIVYVPVFHYIFGFLQTKTKIKNKIKTNFKYLGYY